jgi:hypothetical protein
MKSGSRGFIQNLFCKFWTFLQVSTNFGSLKQFLLFKTIRKMIKSPAQYWAKTSLRLQPTGRGVLPHAVGRKADWAMAWQPSPVGQMACAAHCNACAPRAPRRGHHAQTARGMAWWRARWRLSGGSTVARCCGRSRGGHREGAGQGGEGRGAPERREESFGTVAFARGEGAPVVVVECDEVLQLGRGKGVRKLQEIARIGGSRRSSPGNGGRWRRSAGI